MRLITTILALTLSAAAQAEYGSVTVDEYVRAYDGDTVTVSIHEWPAVIGEEISVRFRGVDTPEIRASCDAEYEAAIEARDYVRGRMSEADEIRLERIGRGSFFRIVADVVIDGEVLADTLIDKGLGVAYEDREDAGWCN